MNANRTRTYQRLTPEEADDLIRDGIIVGGMIPKLESCLYALNHGVRSAHIINGNREHNLLLELFTDNGVGTMIQQP